MAEETEDSPSTFGDLKKTFIGILATIMTAAGGIVITQFENLFLGGDEPTEVVQPAPQNITINVPTQQPQIIRERVIEKEPDTVVVEQPKESAKDKLLKYKKGQ